MLQLVTVELLLMTLYSCVMHYNSVIAIADGSSLETDTLCGNVRGPLRFARIGD